MNPAAKRKSILAAWLCALIVVLCPGETRAREIFDAPQPASGQIQAASPEGVGENYDASAYDAPGYAVAPKTGLGLADDIGILKNATKGKGNFGLGSGTRADASRLGKAWVGDGYRISSDGTTLLSKNGLRQYRPPSNKPRLGKTQANFEQRFPGQKSKGWQSNGHLDITD